MKRIFTLLTAFLVATVMCANVYAINDTEDIQKTIILGTEEVETNDGFTEISCSIERKNITDSEQEYFFPEIVVQLNRKTVKDGEILKEEVVNSMTISEGPDTIAYVMFTNLPTMWQGMIYKYNLIIESVADDGSVDGSSVVLKYVSHEQMQYFVSKDFETEHRPSEVVFHLYRDGKDTEQKLVLTEENDYNAVFENLLMYDQEDGHRYAYSVKEDSTQGYEITGTASSVTSDSNDIHYSSTSAYTGGENVSVNGTVTIEDEKEFPGIRLNLVQDTIKNNAVIKSDIIDSLVVVNSSEFIFNELKSIAPDGICSYEYRVTADEVDGYIISVSGSDFVVGKVVESNNSSNDEQNDSGSNNENTSNNEQEEVTPQEKPEGSNQQSQNASNKNETDKMIASPATSDNSFLYWYAIIALISLFLCLRIKIVKN